MFVLIYLLNNAGTQYGIVHYQILILNRYYTWLPRAFSPQHQIAKKDATRSDVKLNEDLQDRFHRNNNNLFFFAHVPSSCCI